MKKWMMATSMLLLLIACFDEEVVKATSAAPTENVESVLKVETAQVIDNSKENLSQIFSEGTFVADKMVIGFLADVSEKVNAIVAKMAQRVAKNEAGDEEVVKATSAASTENVERAEKAIDNSKENLSKTFSEGIFVADKMVIGFPVNIGKRVNAILAKMEQGMIENEAWIMETIKSLEKGELLPYDERLGVTEDEYKYFIESEQYMKLGKVGENELTISKEAGQATIQIANGSIVNEITIRADGNTVQTNLGELSYLSEFIASDEQYVMGRWNGHTYKLGGDGTQQLVKITFGRLEENNKKIIHIEFYEEGQGLKDEILMFD